jgi:3-isopropylmalate dehydrogenase
MNKSLGIIAGEHGAETMELVIPLMETLGDFDYITALGSQATREQFPGLPPNANKLTQSVDAVLLGHINGPEEVSTDPGAIQPDSHVRELQTVLGAHVVVQPVVAFETLAAQSPLGNDRVEGTDLVVVHALGDFYLGDKGHSQNGSAYDRGEYTLTQVKDVGRVAFDLARNRATLREATSRSTQIPRVTSVDKANVLEASRLWRSTMEELQREEYPDIDLKHLLIDNAAMEMVAHPSNYDVVVSNHMFGDTLAGEVAAITSPVLVPSAALNRRGQGIYRPARPEGVHSAPAIILSMAQALRHSLDMPEAAQNIEDAVERAFAAGAITPALHGRTPDREFAAEVVQNLGSI